MIIYRDKKEALTVVTQHGFALHYVSTDLQNDKDVVLLRCHKMI